MGGEAVSEPVKTWRYALPSERGEGWAEIVICSSGFFGAVSDYGNYAFAWRHTGCDDVREFFLRARRDWDYFAHKLGGEHSEVYDSEATVKRIKEHIVANRRSRRWSSKQAREEFDLIDECEDLDSVIGFSRWYDQTPVEDAWEMRCSRVNRQLEAFCKSTMARLADAIAAELESERKAVANG